MAMNIMKGLRSLMATDIAVDLGTANTLVYTKNVGIVLDEPSVVAVEVGTGAKSGPPRVLAVGRKAKEMYGRTSDNIQTIRPMKDGVIADFDVTKAMIQHFIKATMPARRTFGRPTMMICVPSGITTVEMKAVIDSASQCGAGRVHLIEEPMAAAIGSKLPIHEVSGSMIVDIGGGTTEVAVISRYAIAYSESLRMAGDAMDECIQRHLRRNFGLSVGLFDAERVKTTIGTASPPTEPIQMEISGSAVPEGIPRSITLGDEAIREALEVPVNGIIEAIRKALSRTTPELASDIRARGIVLAGGGSLLKGLGARIHKEIGLQVFRVRDPLTAVVRGTGYVLDNLRSFRKVCLN